MQAKDERDPVLSTCGGPVGNSFGTLSGEAASIAEYHYFNGRDAGIQSARNDDEFCKDGYCNALIRQIGVLAEPLKYLPDRVKELQGLVDAVAQYCIDAQQRQDAKEFDKAVQLFDAQMRGHKLRR